MGRRDIRAPAFFRNLVRRSERTTASSCDKLRAGVGDYPVLPAQHAPTEVDAEAAIGTRLIETGNPLALSPPK